MCKGHHLSVNQNAFIGEFKWQRVHSVAFGAKMSETLWTAVSEPAVAGYCRGLKSLSLPHSEEPSADLQPRHQATRRYQSVALQVAFKHVVSPWPFKLDGRFLSSRSKVQWVKTALHHYALDLNEYPHLHTYSIYREYTTLCWLMNDKKITQWKIGCKM